MNTTDYSQYLCPWEDNVIAQAKADKKLHYYFMAGEQLFISIQQKYADKWGDACLIVFPDGKTLLLDAAPLAYGPVLRRNLQKMGVTRLDYILVSHPHTDHQDGVFHPENLEDGVLAHIPVGMVYHRGGSDPTRDDWDFVQRACEARNIPHQVLQRGDTLQIGEVSIRVLWPRVGTCKLEISGTADVNNSSIVVRFDYGKHSALFPGDLYKAGEADFLENTDPEAINVDFLKVPHHGFGTSSSEELLRAISPRLAVAMARVPITEEIRNRYRDAGILLLYDLLHGYIHLEAEPDGTMCYTTTRNDTPDPSLNILSEDLKAEKCE